MNENNEASGGVFAKITTAIVTVIVGLFGFFWWNNESPVKNNVNNNNLVQNNPEDKQQQQPKILENVKHAVKWLDSFAHKDGTLLLEMTNGGVDGTAEFYLQRYLSYASARLQAIAAQTPQWQQSLNQLVDAQEGQQFQMWQQKIEKSREYFEKICQDYKFQEPVKLDKENRKQILQQAWYTYKNQVCPVIQDLPKLQNND